MFIGPLISPRASIPSNHVFNFLTEDMISGGGKKRVLRCIQTNLTKIDQDQEKYHCFHHCFLHLCRLMHLWDSSAHRCMLIYGRHLCSEMQADMHSYLQWMQQYIHIYKYNASRYAFIFAKDVALHSYLRCMPQCIHIASEWNCFLLTLEPPSQQSLPVKTQTGSNLRLASTSDHADKTEVAQILTLLPILSGEYQEDVWKIPGEYQTGFNLRLASKSDETEVAQILTLF